MNSNLCFVEWNYHCEENPSPILAFLTMAYYFENCVYLITTRTLRMTNQTRSGWGRTSSLSAEMVSLL